MTDTKQRQPDIIEEASPDQADTLVDTANAALENQPDPTGTLAAERDRYLDQLQRERADFANFRRRVDQERALARQLASRDILAQLLPVMDDFNRALAAVPPEFADSGWVSGTAMVGKKLLGVLERFGVEPIDALGQRFDPAVHEAVATEPGTSGDYVVEVYQDGYQLGTALLRPAMVKTGDAVPEPAVATKTNGEDESDASEKL
ncbi:MAG TPA: nucleotide exchange factor GrpE [Thermomicrobiales bacterium]|nr:nucleotide exchange factor GrpE [Thermomicrobiales bacterium]